MPLKKQKCVACGMLFSPGHMAIRFAPTTCRGCTGVGVVSLGLNKMGNPRGPLPEKKLTTLVNPLRPQTEAPLNHIAILVDESGSMAGLATKVPEVVLSQINTIKQAAYDTKQETLVSIYTFDKRPGVPIVRTHCVNTIPAGAKFGPYRPYGDTPLNDAVNQVIMDLEGANQNRADESFLLIVVTDGEENASSAWAPPGAKIKSLQATNKWSFAFLVPPGAASTTARATGVPAGNIKEWEGTVRGLEKASYSTQSAIGSYYVGRAQGLTSTKSFFTDLSGVTSSDLQKLDNLAGEFKRWKVDKEEDISKFVEKHGLPYEIGRAYYQLTKAERVQAHKQLVIGEKQTTKLYGGPGARKLLGITAGPGVEVRVQPGNHANYDIFVESTSTNRKLVRGTDLLYKVV